jgi:Tfp pilus assembly protein FimT
MNHKLSNGLQMAIVADTKCENQACNLDDAGFAVLDLLVVIAVLGLLVAFVAPRVLNNLHQAKTSVVSHRVV